MAILNAGIVAPTGGYQISRSLRFNSADSAYLNRTPGSAGNRRTWTWSGWVKRSALGSQTFLFNADNGSANSVAIDFFNEQLRIYFVGGTYQVATSQVFRDPSAWYHLLFSVDTTQATSSNRVKLYVNGSQVTALSTASYPIQNLDTAVNNTVAHNLGFNGVSNYFNGYLTEINFIDGQALTPSSFGETDTVTGVWKPKKYTGTYGTNGFYLNFSDNSGTTSTTLGKDSSGNGNNWTPNNFSVTAGAGNDSLVDTPTPYGTDTGVGGEVRGNYCTFNPLSARTTTLTNGNLDASTTNGMCAGTIAVSSGKWYWEFTPTDSTAQQVFGIVSSSRIPLPNYPGATADSYGYYANGQKYNNGTGLSYGASFGNGNVIGVALDLDAGTLVFYKNGVSQGTAYSSISGTFLPAAGNAATNAWTSNFGQRPFAYTAPSGFKALCTQNLPEPTIADGGDYFNTVLYTGNGSTQSITGVGFQPDWVWVKNRTLAANHRLFDAVRGSSKILYSSLTNAEATDTTGLTSFDADGFSIGANQVNDSGSAFVAWNWKANGAGSSNTAGTITSTVSVNTTSGFSIVTYTGNGTAGATVGHGLGVTPALIIVKRRDGGTNSWNVQHQSVNYNSVLFLDLTSAATVNSNFNSTGPTSSVFYLGSSDGTNGSGGTKTYVAYCFAPVAGYSAFGSYTGNSSTDGPFIYTGFRPAFVLIKRTDSTSSWWMMDSKRDPYNVNVNYLIADGSGAEATYTSMDFLSNGFKPRNTSSSFNSGTHIYMAFAESPFRYSLAR